jgi:hypothetical protein
MYKIYRYWKKKELENMFYMNILLNFEMCISSVSEVSCRALKSACSITAAVNSPSSTRISSIRCKGNRWHSNVFLSLGSKETSPDSTVNFRIVCSQNWCFRFWIYCDNASHVTFYIHSPWGKYEEIWEYLVFENSILATQETEASFLSIHEENNNKSNHDDSFFFFFFFSFCVL